MVTAERDGEPLPEDQIIGNTYLLLDAGTHTTSSLISHGLTQLDWHRDQRQWLAENPDGCRDALEEIIRYDSPLRVIRRVSVRESTSTGRRCPRAPRSSCSTAPQTATSGAGRTPTPSTSNASRSGRWHSATASTTAWALIARFEAAIALAAVLERLPEYELNGPLVRIRSHMMNGYTSIPVSTGL